MNRANARSYDLFKTIVAVILALILLLMLLRGSSTNAAAPAPTQIPPIQNPTETLPASPVVTETASSVESTQTPTASPEPTAVEPTTTPITAAAAANPTATPAPSPETATATPAPAQTSSCSTASPSRLSVGQTARVLQRLNVRSDASIKAAIIKVDPPNTQVKITGGPVCEPVGNHAYLWWQIQIPDGTQGWSAEMPLNSTNYFMEPVQ